MTTSLAAALLAIVGATLVSEDLTAIGVGLSIRDGQLPWGPALAACTAGIYLGDVALWAAGRFGGRRLQRWPRVATLSAATLRDLGTLVDRHPGPTILGSRFLPGTRLPLYIAAGLFGTRPWRFLGWMLLAVALWTPFIVLGTVTLGRPAAAALEPWLGSPLGARLLVALLILAGWRAIAIGATRGGRARLSARLTRWTHWEFWPMWLFQVPVGLWLVWLALRYRSATLFSAANPAIEDGGIAGESKSAILGQLPPDRVMPWTLVPPGPLGDRVACARAAIEKQGWTWPVVVKPDVGERGTGVRIVHDLAHLERVLEAERAPVIVQERHPGPFEAGIFYVRHPAEAHGRIFSLTDKRFPIVIGDGRSSLETLILAHPRYRLQAGVFLARHRDASARVPAAGEPFQLAHAGNHCQGTEFRDGRRLVTPALEAAIDRIAGAMPGFYFGRFDVRYASPDAFAAGEGFAILELNGVTSEATHVYDPDARLVDAWRTLMRQWSIAFAIGAANRASGHRPIGLRRLFTIVLAHLRRRPRARIAD